MGDWVRDWKADLEMVGRYFYINVVTGAMSWCPRFGPEADAKPVLTRQAKKAFEGLNGSLQYS